MKVCLAAINSKYIHTNPAVDSLQAYAESKGYKCESVAFSINQTDEFILKKLYGINADIYAFSVYIWNVVWVRRLAKELKKIRPEAVLWVGGPEVSYDSTKFLEENDVFTGLIRGEGEKIFVNLLKAYAKERDLSEVRGISYRSGDGSIVSNPDEELMNMDELVFPYYGREPDPHRIYYYESSRGCPFNCAYCLSSVDKRLRFKSIERVKGELRYFLDNNATQIKFVDRTFNAKKSHAMEIWSYIKENDNGVTNFHFEIGGDLLDEEELELLKSLRRGQVQLEIGVQTTNSQTMSAVNRVADWSKIAENVRKLISFNNIHIHLDLIAGLPGEDIGSFKKTFNDVYALKPSQLQLGFLKVLKGTAMKEEKGYKYLSQPPYEVLETPWLEYDHIIELKSVEEIVEVYYNSHQFEKTVEKLESFFKSSYEMFHEIALFYEKNNYFDISHSRMKRYEILLSFIRSKGFDDDIFIPLLLMDAYAREKLNHFPNWGKGYEFNNPFDYENRDPLTGNAEYIDRAGDQK